MWQQVVKGINKIVAPLVAHKLPAFWRRTSAPHVLGAPAFEDGIALEQSTLCELVGQHPWPGWNMLELDGLGADAHGAASLTLYTSRGEREFSVSLRPGKTTKRLIWVPFGVKRITLTFLASKEALAKVSIEWVWLTPWFAHDRLARRLINNHPRYKGMQTRQVVRSLHVESVAQAKGWRNIGLSMYDETHIKQHVNDDYTRWIDTTELAASRDPHELMTALPFTPLFSFVMPVLPSDLERGETVFTDTLNSLKKQSYFFWEIFIVLSADISAEQRRELENVIPLSSRVNLIHSHQTHFAQLDHQGFVNTQGDGVVRISVGDQLSTEALCQMAEAWNDYPDAQLIYSDEDSLNKRGERCQPVFKPAWNPDLLLSTNYVGRLAVYKRRLLWQFEADQLTLRSDLHDAPALDYALALTFLIWQSTYGSASTVCHVPFMLYHRHSKAVKNIKQETAVSLVSKVLSQYVASLDAQVYPGLLPTSVRTEWPIPTPEPLVSLLVPTRNGVQILRPCVDAILERTHYRHFELLILDNQSDCPETLAYMQEVTQRDERVRVLRWDEPFNYSAINNFGASQAHGSIIGLINNDVEPINEEWLTEMVSHVCRSEIGCVGAKLYYPNGMLQHGGVILGLGDVAGHAHRFFSRDSDGYTGRLKLTQNLSAVTAACLLLRKSVFNNVGGLNEQDLTIAYNDVDLCLKVREAGYRNLWTPHAELYHHESISRGADDTPKKRARWLSEVAYMRRTWAKELDHDPAYNPNLTLVHEDFSLR